MTNQKIRRAYLLGFVLVVAFTVPLWVKNLYVIHLLFMTFLSMVFAMSLGLIFKMGYLSLGHAAYIGAGAYSSALLATSLGLPFWVSFFLAGATTALIAFFIGHITLGLRGIYFTITTFSLTEVFDAVWSGFKTTFGGPSGIMNIPRPPGIETKGEFYTLALVFLLGSFYVFFRLSRSSFGLLCDGLSLNWLFEECLGVNTKRMKTVVFVISCTFAGLGGSILAHYLGHISPANFTMFLSTEIIVYLAVGGLGSVTGAAIGAAFLTVVSELLYGAGFYRSLVFGTILIVMVLALPGGLIRIPWRKIGFFRDKREVTGGPA